MAAVAQPQNVELANDPGQMVKDFTLQDQECSNWCWAAVASSTDVCYAHGGPSLSQCQVATLVLKNKGNCCNHPSPVPLDFVCNVTAHTDDALSAVHRLRRVSSLPISFVEIQKEIEKGRVIGCSVGDLSGTHAVAISGWDISLGQERVLIQDPFGSSRTLSYDDFRNDNSTNFQWRTTYLTKRPVPPVAAIANQVQAFRREDMVMPADARFHVLSEQAAQIVAPNNSLAAALAAAGGPSTARHHKMFVATVQQAREGSILVERQPACLRHILFEGEPATPVGAVEATIEGKILSVSRGQSAPASFAKFQEVSSLPEVMSGEFEPRYLKINSLSVVALWLHNKHDGGQDRIYPLEPTKALSTERVYSAAEFLDECRRAALQRGTVQP